MDELAEPSAGDGRASVSVEQWAEGTSRAVKIAGELDLSSVDAVRPALEEAAASLPSSLVFDLSELRFIDSSGLALLLVAAREVGAVRMRNPTPAVWRVIEVTGLNDVLPLEP